jgi:cation diffusion facilitator family transporter
VRKFTQKISKLGVVLNLLLFIAKFSIGLISGSIAIFSDALNSFMDVLSSIGVFIAVKISDKKPDLDHPFGHHRAEPIAGLIVAVLVCVFGIEIMLNAVTGFFNPQKSSLSIVAISILVLTIIIKFFMSVYFLYVGKKFNSPALKASGIDSRSDVLVSSLALISVVFSMSGFPEMEYIGALVIGVVIIYSGYKIGSENIDYLMGKCPPLSMIAEMRQLAYDVPGVKGLNDLHAHYVGNYVQVELHIEVTSDISTKKSHDIGKKVEKKLEKLAYVSKAFIHIDPL